MSRQVDPSPIERQVVAGHALDDPRQWTRRSRPIVWCAVVVGITSQQFSIAVQRCRSRRPKDAGTVLVAAMDPQVLVDVTGEAQLYPVADEVTTKLQAAIDSLRRLGRNR